LSITGTLPAVLLVKNVQAEPGGQVWLEFVAGGYRVTHIRTVVSTRLGEVGWVAPRGFVASLVLAPFLGVSGWLAALAGWDAVKVVVRLTRKRGSLTMKGWRLRCSSCKGVINATAARRMA
jgi:hypothetical protein